MRNRLIQKVRYYSLSEPVYNSYGAVWASRIFWLLFIIVSVFVFLAVEVGNGYDSVATLSPNYAQTSSSLWYENSYFGSLLPSWTCQGSVIQRGQAVVTASGFLIYRLVYFINEASAKSEDGLLYSDNNLTNCSPLMLNLVAFGQSSTSRNDTPILLSCTTDTGSYLVATSDSTSASWNPLGLEQFLPLPAWYCKNITDLSASKPPTFPCGMQYYWYILQSLLALLSPPSDSESAFMVALAAQGISSFRIFYTMNGTDNTPANDYWYLSMGYTLDNHTVERIVNIALSPEGTVDTIRTSQSDLAQATRLLTPLASFVQSQTNSTIDIWKLLNGLFVGYYWFILGDLGQTSPVNFNNSADFLVPLNTSEPLIYHAPTNNLFLNTTLAESVFSDIGLDETIVGAITIPHWAANGPSPKFRWIYLCTEKVLKPFLPLVVSVFGLSFGLLSTIYLGGIQVFGWILSCTGHKRGRTDQRPIKLSSFANKGEDIETGRIDHSPDDSDDSSTSSRRRERSS